MLNKKTGSETYNLSCLQCDESTQWLRPLCEYAGTRTGQQVNSMFLLWIVSVKMYGHFAPDWLDNTGGVCAELAGTTYVKFSVV